MAYGRMVYDPPTDGLLRTVAANTEDMLTFHVTREESHHYASPFYTWPFIWKPMLYATDIVDYTRSSVINDMGNPAVWWVGVPCLIYCLYCFARKKDKRAGFLVASYLAQFLPWGVVMLFSNLTFLYHYYPATFFMMLAIGYTLDRVAQVPKWGKAAVYGYLAVVIAMFVVFYPAISGRSTAIAYLERLRWLPEWVIMVF
jgi:dolichyl-phosphate-mannose--protein O-mannosyl transferase